MQETYRTLGGVEDAFPLNLRRWDIDFNGTAVELDEQLRFNRYRAETLTADVYSELPDFPLAAYRSYGFDHEDACQRAGRDGGKWTSTSSERQFEPSRRAVSYTGAAQRGGASGPSSAPASVFSGDDGLTSKRGLFRLEDHGGQPER